MSKRAHLHNLVREMRRYLAWQQAGGAPGFVPATEEERASFEARKKALEQARTDALRARLMGEKPSERASTPKAATTAPHEPTPERHSNPRKLPDAASPSVPSSSSSPTSSSSSSSSSSPSTSAASGKSISASTPLWKGQPAMYQMRKRREEMQQKKRKAAGENRAASSSATTSNSNPKASGSTASASSSPANARPPRTEPDEPAFEYDEDEYLQGRPASGPAPGPEDEYYETAPTRPAKLAKKPMSPQEKMDFLADYLSDCQRCGLCKSRQNVILGSGDPQAELVFLGHAPGVEEDREGQPFVGAGGELLTKMIAAMGLSRDEVYLSNMVKCLPPKGRMPAPDEVSTCAPFLKKQLEVLNPRVIVTLGDEATAMLLGEQRPLAEYRGQWQDYEGMAVMPTHHPDFLVKHQKNRAYRGEAWSDLQAVMKRLGIN